MTVFQSIGLVLIYLTQTLHDSLQQTMNFYYVSTYYYIAVAVSILPGDYNVTEGNDTSIEVCVEIVMGTVNMVAAIEVQTISGSATG